MRCMIFMKILRVLSAVLMLFIVCGAISSAAVAEEKIVATIYFSARTTCGTCVHRNQTLTVLEQNYSESITFIRKNYDIQENQDEARELGITSHPGMVIEFQGNQTVINPVQIPTTTNDEKYTTLEHILENYLEAYELANQQEPSEFDIYLQWGILALGGVVLVLLVVVSVYLWKREHQ